MVRTKSAMIRSVTAMVAAVGSLVCLAGPAEAFDSGTCNSLFCADNVRRAVAFKIDTGAVGKVDFADHLHLGGAPQGTAVVCSSKTGAVALKGYLCADSSDLLWVQAEITYFRGDVVGATSQHQVTGNNAASTLVNELKSGGVFTKIRLRLFRKNTLVHTKNISL
jgi:hypothetical protein